MNFLSAFRRRGSRAAWLTLGGLVAVSMMAAFLGACAAKAEAQLYQCPMHPDYVSDKPGDCPICGMRLVPMKGTAAKKAEGPKLPPAVDAAHSTGAATQKEVWVCPMDADVESDKPGKCPKCGMDLVKKTITVEPENKESAVVPASMSAGDGTSANVEGLAPVHTENGRAVLAGVRTVEAKSDSVVSAIRAVGTVVPDETRIRQVTTKVGGFVEKLYVNAVGQSVKAGQPLFELYSPELLASQEEYLRARQTAEEFSKSSMAEVRRGGEDLAAAARRRLELFDVPGDFLHRLEQSGKVQRTVTFRAPFNGHVTEKMVLEGQKVEPGMNLLTITDLSRVWVAGQLYEAEARAAQPGRPATISLQYDANTSLTGRVSLVYPTVDAETRTIKVRFEFPNPRLLLKPGMFVNVALEASRRAGIVVPDSAVIDSGTRQVVFVEAGPGHFEPRDVQVATRGDGKAVLHHGVNAGERVAVAANFLLDSESRLRGAAAAKATSQAAVPAGHQHGKQGG